MTERNTQSTAADGKTELVSVQGHPLLVSAVAFNQLVLQRDELLGALRMLLATAGEINDAPDGLLEMALESDDQETRNQANAHLCARAAIAKVEGAQV